MGYLFIIVYCHTINIQQLSIIKRLEKNDLECANLTYFLKII